MTCQQSAIAEETRPRVPQIAVLKDMPKMDRLAATTPPRSTPGSGRYPGCISNGGRPERQTCRWCRGPACIRRRGQFLGEGAGRAPAAGGAEPRPETARGRRRVMAWSRPAAVSARDWLSAAD
jgi:hypothetical protein